MEAGVLGTIIGRIIRLVGDVGSVSWSFVKRTENDAANLLAHMKPSFTFVDFDLDSFPVGLFSIVANDIA